MDNLAFAEVPYDSSDDQILNSLITGVEKPVGEGADQTRA
jgi:hypothetical protein